MQNWRRHSIFWPLLLITAGVLLFLNNLGNLPGTTWEMILRLWPLLLIVAGLDGFWKGEGYAGATVVTGLGVIFLMGNLGYLSLSAWDLIIKLWPIFLVAIGLDILIGKRRPWSAVVGVLVGLAVTAGIFWLVVSSPFSVTYNAQAVNLTLDSIQGQNVRGTISMPVGQLNLAGGAEGNTLLEGDLKLSSSETYSKNVYTSGNTTTFDLESRGYGAFVPFSNSAGQEEWNVHLNPAPVYDLTFKLAVGESNLDLTTLTVSDVNVQNAVGKTVLSLPGGKTITGRVQNAIGETVIRVPQGAPVRVRFERALTSTSQPSDFTLSGHTATSPSFKDGNGIDITVNQAIGSIRVEYLPNN